MRQVSWNHCVDLALLFDKINLDREIQIENANTNKQVTDVLTGLNSLSWSTV